MVDTGGDVINLVSWESDLTATSAHTPHRVRPRRHTDREQAAALVSEPSAKAAVIEPVTHYQILSRHSGKVVDIAD